MCNKVIAYFSSIIFLFSLVGGSYLISHHLNAHFEEEFHLKTLVLLLLIILVLMGINAWVFASVVANCLFS